MNISSDLIKKFLSNECTPKEAGQVAVYLREHPEVAEEWIREKDLLEEDTVSKLDAARTKSMWEGIGNAARIRPAKISRIRYYIAAASILVMIIAGALLFRHPKKDSPALAKMESNHLPKTDMMAIKTNTSAQSLQLSLPDGSIAVLASGSVLKYRPSFEASARRLYLQGTADFQVKSDVRRPFSVEAEGYATTVLGTSFRIVAVPGAANLRVELFTGKVSVDKIDKDVRFSAIILSPGQQATISKSDWSVSRGPINPQGMSAVHPAITGPAQTKADAGDMTFRQTPLADLFKTLQQRYSVTITFDPAEIADKDFTGTFHQNESVGSILENIAVLYNLNLEKNEKGFNIKK